MFYLLLGALAFLVMVASAGADDGCALRRLLLIVGFVTVSLHDISGLCRSLSIGRALGVCVALAGAAWRVWQAATPAFSANGQAKSR